MVGGKIGDRVWAGVITCRGETVRSARPANRKENVAMSMNQVLEHKLKQRADISEHEWSIWEYKTLNMHRAVLVWEPEQAPPHYSKISETIRNKVKSLFKVSWWRGLGFGIVVVLPSPPPGIEACVDDIDTRENSKGTWQWSVLVFKQHNTVVGVHMWMQGYLSSTYQQLIQSYESTGHKAATFKKEKDKLMQFLTTASVFTLPEFDNTTKRKGASGIDNRH